MQKSDTDDDPGADEGGNTPEKDGASQSPVSPSPVKLDRRAEQPLDFLASLLRNQKEGFDYLFVDLEYRKGSKLGLVIRNYESKVMVSRLEKDSLGYELLGPGDAILAIEGKPTKDRELAKSEILKSFVKRRAVTLFVERPISSEAKLWAKTAILSSSTRTASTAPREKVKWTEKSADQRKAARRRFSAEKAD